MNFQGTLHVVQFKGVLVTVVCLDKNQQSVTATARMHRKADAAPPAAGHMAEVVRILNKCY